MFQAEGWSSRHVQNPSGRREWGKYQGLEEKSNQCGWSSESQRKRVGCGVRRAEEEEQGPTAVPREPREGVSLCGGHWETCRAFSKQVGVVGGETGRFALWRGAEGGWHGWCRLCRR